jgi:hypothetical protein
MLVENAGILSLRHENIELRNEFERRFDVLSQLIESGFATVHGNVRRVAMQPVWHAFIIFMKTSHLSFDISAILVMTYWHFSIFYHHTYGK